MSKPFILKTEFVQIKYKIMTLKRTENFNLSELHFVGSNKFEIFLSQKEDFCRILDFLYRTVRNMYKIMVLVRTQNDFEYWKVIHLSKR